jgi:hypothetical protein
MPPYNPRTRAASKNLEDIMKQIQLPLDGEILPPERLPPDDDEIRGLSRFEAAILLAGAISAIGTLIAVVALAVLVWR